MVLNITDADDTYYPYFDYLRGFAAFGVYLSHNDNAHLLPSQFGNACVQVFFALSGFLIGGILFRSRSKDLPKFYFNRATRIWIPYVIAILLLFVVTAVKQGVSDSKVREFFVYMITFVYNWFGPPQFAAFQSRMPLDGTGNHFWSICVEEQFYLVAPFLIIFATRYLLLLVLALATWLSPNYFASISLGVILALIRPQPLSTLGCAILGMIAALLLKSYVISAPLISVAVISGLAIPGKPMKIGKMIGGASYPFYLDHWIGLFIQNFLMKYGLPFALAMPIGFSAISVGSIGHYLLIDKAIIARRRSWFTSARGATLCFAGFALVLVGLSFSLHYGWPI